MATLMRRAGVGLLVLGGLLAGHGPAQAQMQFGVTPYGLNNNNPFIANRNYLYNLQMARAATASTIFPPFANSIPTPAFNPYAGLPAAPYVPPVAAYGNPYATPYVPPVANAYTPYMGYGANPYAPGMASPVAGSNPYAPAGATDPYASNPYTTSSSLASYGALSNPYANPALGPGYTLMGGADVMRAYGSVITSQEQARLMREQYYMAKLERKKKQFDLDMYIKNNTPTFTEEQAKIARQVLKRIQTNSQPAEIADGRSLNFLLDDIDKHHNKATISDLPLAPEVVKHVNVRPASGDAQSLGLLRDANKLNWPSALVDMLTPDVRNDIEARALSLAQNAAKGVQPDRNALKDLRVEIDLAMTQLLKKANDFGTPEYMEAKRYLTDLENARRAIERGTAGPQLQFQRMVAKGDIQTVNDLVKVMTQNGWRFGPALPEDEAAYRAIHSGLVAYDVALNQQVAQADDR